MIRCIAVDDEPLALDLLEDNIGQVPFLQLVHRCRNAFEATEALQRERIDLVFLDVQMPGLTGLQWLRSLDRRPMVVFVTAYERHALEGYELDVLDYLLKPVSFDRLLKTANKALERHSLLAQAAVQVAAPAPDFFFVNAEYSLVRVNLADIRYVEGLKDYVKIYLAGTPKPVVTRLSLRALEKKLPAGEFIRTHKSYLVQLSRVGALRKQTLMVGEAEIPIGDRYSEAVYACFEKFRF